MREGKDHLPGSTGSSIELDEMTCPDAEPRTCEEVSVVKYSVEDTPPWPLCVLMGLQVSSTIPWQGRFTKFYSLTVFCWDFRSVHKFHSLSVFCWDFRSVQQFHILSVFCWDFRSVQQFHILSVFCWDFRSVHKFHILSVFCWDFRSV